MSINPRNLPPIPRLIVETVGPQYAYAYMQVAQGHKITVGRQTQRNEALQRMATVMPIELAEALYQALSDRYGEQLVVEIPTPTRLMQRMRNDAIRTDTRERRQIAREWGLSERQVRNITNKDPLENGGHTYDLFGGNDE